MPWAAGGLETRKVAEVAAVLLQLLSLLAAAAVALAAWKVATPPVWLRRAAGQRAAKRRRKPLARRNLAQRLRSRPRAPLATSRSELATALNRAKDYHAASMQELEEKLHGEARERLQELEEKLRGELQSISIEHHAKHAEHEARHAEAEEKREQSLQEHSLAMEHRLGEMEVAMQQSIRNLKIQLDQESQDRAAADGQHERAVAEVERNFVEEVNALVVRDAQQHKVLEDKFTQLGNTVADMCNKNEIVKSDLTREITDRTRADGEIEEKHDQLRAILAEAAKSADLLTLEKALQEMAERLKGDEVFKQGLERQARDCEELKRVNEALSKSLPQELTTLLETRVGTAEALIQQVSRDSQSQLEVEAKARAAADQALEEKCLQQLRHVLSEAASAADLKTFKMDLEREVAELKMGNEATDAASKQSSRDLQSQIEQELKNRVAADKTLQEQLSQNVQTLKSACDQESIERERFDKVLEERFIKLGPILSEVATKTDLQAVKNELDMEMTERRKIDQAIDEQLVQLRPFLEAAATKVDLQSLQNALANEIAERVQGGKLFEEQFSKLGPILSEAATKAELQALKSIFEEESAERSKGDKAACED